MSGKQSPDRSAESRQRLYTAIEIALRLMPDLRVGQIIVNAVGGDPFYVENDKLAEKIMQYARRTP